MKRLDAKIKLPNPTKDKGSKMSYTHLTLKERYLINAYKSIKTQKEIAKMIGVHPSTICRELKRGRGKIGKDYWVIQSHQRAKRLQREKAKNANFKLTEENGVGATPIRSPRRSISFHPCRNTFVHCVGVYSFS